jgi:hypothetical protein
MVNYQNAKIYKIITDLSDKVYIGSTTKKYLSQRLQGHRDDYIKWQKHKINHVSSIELFEEFGFENCRIVLIENYPCNSKDELISREEYWRKQFNCVNKRKAKRTLEELKEYNNNNYNNKYKKRILNKRKLNREIKFICEICCRETNKDDLNKHKKRNYHIRHINLNDKIENTQNEYNNLIQNNI